MTATKGYDLRGQRALVTGAGRGIGEACAKTLAAVGAEVVLTARTEKQLEQVRDGIIKSGGKASVHAADIYTMEAVNNLKKLGPFNILVNNAGNNIPEHFCEVSEERFDKVMGLNVKSAFFVAQVVAKGMVESGIRGSIIHVSSQMGIVGGQNRTVYCASKHAMEGFSKSMALDLAENGIRVNTVCPTFIETDLTRPFMEEKEFKEYILSRIPLGHVGQADDVANAVLFLASDMSKMMTGSSIKVDGGWTAV
ncbi:MAG: SDR family oxidoreductase [SAR324 cluster bacterium]|nr:SDR family oxidoreductase [SAR324 cluster bacterium]